MIGRTGPKTLKIMTEPQQVYHIQVARGWKKIARMLDCSVTTAKRLHRECGLPLVDEAGAWTLTTNDYLVWRSQRRAEKGREK